MPTRVVVSLHVAWMAVFVGLALGAGWLFRFEGDARLYYLDRWTGELVDGAARDDYHDTRWSLRAIQNKPPAKPSVAAPVQAPAEPPANRRGFVPLDEATPVDQPPGVTPPAAGEFDDLTPKRGDNE